jgi:hypothetical protein
LIFLEHGFAPEPKIQSWQSCLTPIWKRICGGCCLDKKIDDLISRAGFAIRELHNSYMPGPKPMTYIYRGFAEPDGGASPQALDLPYLCLKSCGKILSTKEPLRRLSREPASRYHHSDKALMRCAVHGSPMLG